MAGESKVAVVGAVLANVAIAISKFIVAGITGSSSMLSEAIHSTVDTGDGLLLLLGQHRSKKPPDDKHPYGYGLELYFWTFVVALIIFGLGGGMSIYEGILHIRQPEPLADPTWNYIVLGIAFVFESISMSIASRQLFVQRRRERRSLWRIIRTTKDPQVVAVFLEDSAALMGLVVAFLGVFLSHRLGLPQLDGVASILIGLLLCSVALLLAREAKGLMVGEAADPRTQRRIRELVEGDPAVERMGPALTLQLSPEEVLLNLQVDFQDELSGRELEQAIERLERKIRAEKPEVRRIFIELKSLTPGHA